jgi:hypothetical protein
MTAQSEAHEKLVAEIAQLLAGRDCAVHAEERQDARAVLSLIAERLSDVTPEMVEAWGAAYPSRTPDPTWTDENCARCDFVAMIAASPLMPGTDATLDTARR